jgi:hypothetical protein
MLKLDDDQQPLNEDGWGYVLFLFSHLPCLADRDYDVEDAREPNHPAPLYELADHLATCGPRAHAALVIEVMIQRMGGIGTICWWTLS